MKREGRQHGMVRSKRILPEPQNPRSKTRFINKFDSPPTAGLFTKVSSKPTNHSKFTGKCGSQRCSCCHLHPVCKSKDKVKGTHKHKSSDTAPYYGVAKFRVVGEQTRSNHFGFSATELVDQILNEYYSENEEEEEEGYEFYEGGNENSFSFGDLLSGHELEVRTLPWKACDDDVDVCISDLGFELDQVEEDEGWYLVDSSCS